MILTREQAEAALTALVDTSPISFNIVTHDQALAAASAIVEADKSQDWSKAGLMLKASKIPAHRCWRCTTCNHDFRTRQLLKVHQIQKKCTQSSTQQLPTVRQRLLYEVQDSRTKDSDDTGDSSLKCRRCGQSFLNYPRKRQHRTNCQKQSESSQPTSNPEVRSSKCSSGQTRSQKLDRKQGMFNKFCCTLCSKVLSSKLAMNYHMNSHFGLKPYKCKRCGKGYPSPAGRNQHQARCLEQSLGILELKTQKQEVAENFVDQQCNPTSTEGSICIVMIPQPEKDLDSEHGSQFLSEYNYSCSKCNAKLISTWALANHVTLFHESEISATLAFQDIGY